MTGDCVVRRFPVPLNGYRLITTARQANIIPSINCACGHRHVIVLVHMHVSVDAGGEDVDVHM